MRYDFWRIAWQLLMIAHVRVEHFKSELLSEQAQLRVGLGYQRLKGNIATHTALCNVVCFLFFC